MENILKDLANYIAENGYTDWENKQVSKPFLRNKYLFVTVALLNKIIAKYGVSSNKVAYGLRKLENSPYITHTVVGFYIKNRKRARLTWVFDMELLMRYSDKRKNTKSKNLSAMTIQCTGPSKKDKTITKHNISFKSKKESFSALLTLFHIMEHTRNCYPSDVTPLIAILKNAYNELITYDKLTPHGIRITDELYDVIKNLANIRYPKEKGAIYKVLVDAFLSLIAFHILSEEELLKFRKMMLTKQLRNQIQKGTNLKLNTSDVPQTSHLIINASEKTILKFREVLEALYKSEAIDDGMLSGFIPIQNFVWAIKRVAGVDFRTIEKWLSKFYEENIVSFYVISQDPTLSTVKWISIEELIKNIRNIVTDYYKSMEENPESQKDKISVIRIAISKMGLTGFRHEFAEYLYRKCEQYWEEIKNERYERFDSEILKVLFKYMARQKHNFIVSLFDRALDNSKLGSPFVILKGQYNGNNVLVYGYCFKPIKIANKKVMQIIMFVAYDYQGNPVPIFRGINKKYWIIFGDIIRTYDTVMRKVLPELESEYSLQIIKLRI